MGINWDDYRFFLAVAESGSLSAAGRQLGVAQPTVGRRVRALEERLGARLFDHRRHGYRLTELGQEVLERVRAIETQTLTVERAASGADARLQGQVSIATTEGLGCWLADKLPALTRRYERLQIDLAVGLAMADLLRREADVALRVGDHGSDELVGRVIGQVGVGLYASAEYLQRRGEPRSLDELPQHVMIDYSRDVRDLQQAAYFRDLCAGGETGLSCNHIAVQMAAARAGVGIAALPVYYLRLGGAELCRVLTTEFAPEIPLWLLTHADIKNTARVRAVMSFIADRVDEDQDLLRDGVN